MTIQDTRARLDRALQDRAIDERMATLVLELADTHAVEVCWSSRTEVAVAAAPDAYGALYVRRGALGIALDRARARELERKYGFAVRENSSATARLQVSGAALGEPASRQVVAGIAAEALDRSLEGPRWSRGLPDRIVRRGGLCPGCGIELPLSGRCADCD